MAKKKKYVLSSQVDYSGIDWSGDEQVQQEREKAAVSNRLKETQSSVSSTNKFLSEDESRALDAKLAAKRAREAAVQARAAADKKAADELAARKSKVFDSQTLGNTLGYLGHAITDPLDELALARTQVRGDQSIGLVEPAEALFMAGYQSLTGAPSKAELQAKVMDNRAKQTARIKDAQAMGISTTPLDIIGSLGQMPAQLATLGGSYTAQGFNDEVSATGDVDAALERAKKHDALNVAFNSIVPGGKVVSEVGLTAAKKLAPNVVKALKPAVSKSATRLGAEELAKHQLGTSAIMTTYGGAELGLNKYTATFSDNAEQRKFANDQLPENAGEVIKELGTQALTGAVVGTVFGGHSSAMTAGKAKAESMMDIQITMDDLARQEAFKKEGKTIDIEVPQAPKKDVPKTEFTEQPDMFGGRSQTTKPNPEVVVPEAPKSNVRDNLYAAQRQSPLFDSMPKQEGSPELGTLTNRTLGEQRSAEMAPHLEEATKIEKKAQASELKKAKAKWNADKRKAAATVRDSNLSLPEAERIDAIAKASKEWAEANPEPTLESLEAARASTATTEVTATPENSATDATPESTTPVASNEITLEELRKIKPDATAADVAAANRPAAQSFNRLVKAVQDERDAGGLAQKGEAPSERATLEDIEAELKGNSGSGEVRTLNALQKNGHVRVVADESLLPKGASRMEGSKHGWFEGDTAYIVADKLKKGEVVQGMLDVAGHEVKHGVDTQGKPYQYSAISNKIIGTDANKRIVAKIEKLAEKGDETAQGIIDVAKQNPKTYELEVAAYALNRANLERSKAGAFAGVSKDLLSTVRTSAKALIGSDNVNLNDLHYLGKRMLAEVAESRERLGKPDGDGEGLGMIVGSNHPRYQEFKDAGLVWEGPDGKERFVLSDASTKLNKPAVLELLGGHKKVTVGALIKNNEALKGYNAQLAKKEIVIDPELVGNNAYASENQIAISKELAQKAVAGFKGENKLITTVLHETQHHIQRVEGHARGANVLDFMPPDDHAAYTAYHNATDALAENVKELETTRPDLHKAFVDDKMTLEEVGSELTKDPATEGFGYEILENQEIADFNKAASDKAFEDAHAKYRQTLGEQEAQLTERTAHLEQDELNPFPFDKDRVDSRPNVFNTESTVSTKRRIAGREADVLIKTPEGVTALKQDGSRERVPSWDATGKEMSQQEGMAYKGMTDDMRNKAADKLDDVDDFLQKIFFSSGKIGDQLMELIRQRGRDAAMMGEHAQSLRVAIGHSVKELMSANNWTSEQAANSIADKIEVLSKVKSVEAREALALDIAKNDPIMAPVIDGFRQINDATRILIRQELEANPHITTERLKQLQSMWDNQWSYTTRAYAAFQGAEGKAYAKTVMDLAYRARDRMARGLKLSKNEAKYHGIVEAATKVIKNSDLTMPKDLNKITDGKRESLYDAWVPGEGYATKKAGLISRAIEAGKDKDTATMEAIAKLTDDLEAYRPRSEDAKELQAKADYIAESILGLRDSSDSIAKVYRGAKADDSIMKHRTDMPEEIRALLGEISDPGLLLSLTLMKQGELIASNKLLRQIKKQGEAAGWIMPRAEAYKNKKMGTPIQEDYLGTLKGMVTTPEIAAVLNTSVEHINGSGQILTRALVDARFGLNGFANVVDSKVQMAARGWKRVTVAYNPYSYGRDFVGSSVTLLANGTLLSNPIKQLDYYGKGGKLAIENIVGTAKGGSATYSVLFDDAIKHGLFESVKVHELRTAFGDSLRSEINPSNSAALNRKIIKYLKRSDATVIQARAMADAWTKIPIWLDRVDALSRYYEANGVKKTISEIKAEAGRDMRKTTVTQEQVPVFAKFLETRGLTTFLPYYIASARALKNNFEMGYMDIVRGLTEATTPEARNIMLVSGTKRLAGSSMAVGVVTYGMQSLADWWNAEGNTEEERKKSLESVDALKQLMFPNSRYGEVLYTGKNEKGEPVFISLSAVDPSGPIGDVLRVLANNDISDEEKGDAILKSAFDTLTSLNKGPLDMLWFGLGAVNGKTTHKGETKIERIAPTMARYIREKMTANDFHNFSRNDANNFLQIISDYTPGAANALDSGNKIVSDGNPLGKVIMYAGGRMETANVGAVLGGTASALKEYRTDTKTSVYEMVKEGSSPEAIFKYVSKRAEEEQEMTTKIRDSYKALTVGLGYSQSKAVATLRGARLDARDITNATKDKPYSSVYEMLNDPKGPLNTKGMATWSQNRARRKNGDEKTAAKEGRELMNKFRVLHLKSGAIQQYTDDEDEGDEDDN